MVPLCRLFRDAKIELIYSQVEPPCILYDEGRRCNTAAICIMALSILQHSKCSETLSCHAGCR